MSRLPNFFLAGAPKAGSTSLYRYLAQHPGIYMSPNKEPHFFASEIREEHYEPEFRPMIARKSRFRGIVTEWEDYLRLFAGASGESALGEASVCYLWSPTAAARIAETVPAAKILAILRDPADRAFSQYLQGLGSGAIAWSFREHIDRNLRHSSGRLTVHYPFLEFGLYGEQLGRYLERFGPNVGIWLHEDLGNRPLDVCRQIFRFLEVSPEFSPAIERRYMEAQPPRSPWVGRLKRTGLWQGAARAVPRPMRPLIRKTLVRKPGTTRLDPADRRYLIDFYRDDIRKLESLIQRDLGPWLRS